MCQPQKASSRKRAYLSARALKLEERKDFEQKSSDYYDFAKHSAGRRGWVVISAYGKS